ncbi:hypothetical protein PM082_021671, partial [Marasmius tenuissimus]
FRELSLTDNFNVRNLWCGARNEVDRCGGSLGVGWGEYLNHDVGFGNLLLIQVGETPERPRPSRCTCFVGVSRARPRPFAKTVTGAARPQHLRETVSSTQSMFGLWRLSQSSLRIMGYSTDTTANEMSSE